MKVSNQVVLQLDWTGDDEELHDLIEEMSQVQTPFTLVLAHLNKDLLFSLEDLEDEEDDEEYEDSYAEFDDYDDDE